MYFMIAIKQKQLKRHKTFQTITVYKENLDQGSKPLVNRIIHII